jgi:hypothetical protein
MNCVVNGPRGVNGGKRRRIKCSTCGHEMVCVDPNDSVPGWGRGMRYDSVKFQCYECCPEEIRKALLSVE